jgi:hypothetical protein
MKKTIVFVLLLSFGMCLSLHADEDEERRLVFDPEWTLKELAQNNSFTPGELKHALNLPEEIKGKTPVGQLGITEEQVARAVSNLREDSLIKRMVSAQALIMTALVLIGLNDFPKPKPIPSWVLVSVSENRLIRWWGLSRSLRASLVWKAIWE